MGDLFHADVENIAPVPVLSAAEKLPQHTFLLLTKRYETMPWFAGIARDLKNIGWGASVWNQESYDAAVTELLKINSPNRFLSIEPMLNEIIPHGLKDIGGVIVGGESGPYTKTRPIIAEWVRRLRDECADAGTKFMFKQVSSIQRVNMQNGFPELDGRIHIDLPWPVRKLAAFGEKQED